MIHTDKTIRRRTFWEVARFGIVGTTAMLVHYGVYYLLLPHTDKNVAYSLGYLISFMANFMLSSYFTFRVSPSWLRLVRFAGSHTVNYLLHMVLFNAFCYVGIPPRLAPLPVYAIAVPINFLLVRYALKNFANRT